MFNMLSACTSVLYINIYMYIYVYTYIHTYIHTNSISDLTTVHLVKKKNTWRHLPSVTEAACAKIHGKKSWIQQKKNPGRKNASAWRHLLSG